MNKFLALLMGTTVVLSACAYNAKQPKDDTYYKKTQGIAWPEEQKPVVQKKAVSKNTAPKAATSSNTNATGSSGTGASAISGSGSTPVPGGVAKEPEEKWHDATAAPQKVAVPSAVEKKIQCVKKGDAYTCRWGQTVCGLGCQADGSNCSYGYCLKSECDDVLGQKWDWTLIESTYASSRVYGCKHPNYNIYCYPHGRDGILCSTSPHYFDPCGKQCNKNGTDCGEGYNNCWDKYH